MSYAMGLGAGRPRPAAIVALSCFVPTVEGWEPDFTAAADLPVYHAHGAADPIIGVEFGRGDGRAARRAASTSPTASTPAATRSTRGRSSEMQASSSAGR